MKYIVIALLVNFGLSVVDITTTVIGLSGGAVETNPLFYSIGFPTLLLIKVIYGSASFPFFILAYRYLQINYPKLTYIIWFAVGFLIILNALFVVNNVLVLRALSSIFKYCVALIRRL